MRHGSLFSGIGGFDLAAEWMGWQNVFHCEWNPFGQRHLKYYWPNAISYHDITKTDFTIHRGGIDIVTGGFPCQPYSTAGKRLGKADERHLFPEMLRAIKEIKPRWVVGENVRGLVSWNGGMVFDEVCADLESEGYEVIPFLIPAAGVNAPHRRDRVWFVAHANSCRMQESILQHTDISARPIRNNKQTSQNTVRDGCLRGELKQEGAEVWQQRDLGAGDPERIRGEELAGTTTNTTIERYEERQQSFGWKNTEKNRREMELQSERLRGDGYATDTNGFGLRRQGDGIGNTEQFGKNCTATDWQNFPTVSPLCNGNDGLSDRLDGITFSKWRNESIKGGGNAVVPQVVLQIYKAIDAYEHI